MLLPPLYLSGLSLVFPSVGSLILVVVFVFFVSICERFRWLMIGGICGIKRNRGGRDLFGVDQEDGFGSVQLEKEVLKRDVSKNLPRRFGYQGVVGTIWRWDLVTYGSQKARKCYGVLLRIGMDMTVKWMWSWIGSSGLLTWKQAPCLVSSNQSQRVDSDMAKVLRSILRLDQIDARMVTRPVDELYADLASIHSTDIGSTNSMLMIHLDNGNNPGNGGYLYMLFGLGWTGSSRLLSIDLIANDHFGESYGAQWNSVEPNLGHKDGSDLLNHQMTLSR
ncbi:hypothetical protein YC2023_118784 [Brassica napus]